MSQSLVSYFYLPWLPCHLLNKVEDEEGVQTKGWNIAIEQLSLRAFVEPELAHPLWNGFKRALRQADLEFSTLKLTVVANFNHGSFSSGDKLYTKMDALRAWLELQTPEFFEEKAELVSFDRGEEHDADQTALALEEWMQAPLIKNRGAFVFTLVLCHSVRKHVRV
jgi:hypothetical protein